MNVRLIAQSAEWKTPPPALAAAFHPLMGTANARRVGARGLQRRPFIPVGRVPPHGVWWREGAGPALSASALSLSSPKGRRGPGERRHLIVEVQLSLSHKAAPLPGPLPVRSSRGEGREGFAPSQCSAKAERSAFLPLLTIALSLLCGCDHGNVASTDPKPEPLLEVHVTHPFRGTITRSIILPGDIKPLQAATLYAKVTGYLKTISVDKGDRVKTGMVLAELEVPELLADRAKYQAEMQVADIDYKRLGEAKTKAPDLVVPLTVDAAKARADMARASLDRAETLLRYATIVAPFSGVVTKRLVDPGAFIPAATSGTAPQNAALLTLMDFDTVRLQVAVPETEAPRIAKDQPVQVTVEGLPGRAFEGKVTRFSYALDEATRTMLAEIELPNPKLELRPGMYATVKLGLERKDDGLLVPVGSLLVEKAGSSVFTVVESKAIKVPVKTGFNDGINVEILSGVKPGDSIVLLGKRTLGNGQPVNVTEGK